MAAAVVDRAHNAELLAFLRRQASPPPRRGYPFELEGWELHTHPDLHERLLAAGAGLPPACETAVYGYPMLAARSVIFAVALGTSTLVFRLPTTLHALASQLGGAPREELGPEWMAFYACDPDVPLAQMVDDLRYWCERAHAHACAFGETA